MKQGYVVFSLLYTFPKRITWASDDSVVDLDLEVKGQDSEMVIQPYKSPTFSGKY